MMERIREGQEIFFVIIFFLLSANLVKNDGLRWHATEFVDTSSLSVEPIITVVYDTWYVTRVE